MICLSSVIIFSCKKGKVKSIQPIARFDTSERVLIHDIECITDSIWMVCGGIRDSRGVIMRTEDAGKSWTKFETEFPRSVYCLDFLNEMEGFAGADFLHLWRTIDGGKTWTFYWLGDQVPVHEEDRPGIKDFQMVNDSLWFFCGGENLGEGVVYETQDSGQTWNFIFKQNEFRDLTFFDDSHAITTGHGCVLLFKENLDEIAASSFENDFMTSSVAINNRRAIGVSYNGGIYKTSDGGNDWQVIDKVNKPFGNRTNWNSITKEGSHLVAVGNEGAFGESHDNGENWEFFTVEAQPDLLSVAIKNGVVLASTTDGFVLQLY